MKDKIEKIELLVETYQKHMRKLLEEHPNKELVEKELQHIEEFTDFRNALMYESDRGCVLMSAAFIEDKITQLLKTYMIQDLKKQKDIFEGNGALGTFSSKIDIAFLLGLIPKNILNDLHILRRIRNDFAHNAKPITFTTDYVKDRCNALQVVNKEALRDDTKAYFLRSMTTILTYVNMKMDTFEKCTEENEFDPSILNNGMSRIIDKIIKE